MSVPATAIENRFLTSSIFGGADEEPVIVNGQVVASAQDVGAVTIGSFPTFTALGGVWIGGPVTDITTPKVVAFATTMIVSGRQTVAADGTIDFTFNSQGGPAAFLLQLRLTMGGLREIGFFGAGPVVQQTMAGIVASIAAVADANAKAALNQIVALLVAYGLGVAT